MIGQVIRLKIQKNKVTEFEALVGKLMEDVTANEPGSIYDIRRVKGEPLTYLYFISFPDSRQNSSYAGRALPSLAPRYTIRRR